MVQTFLKECMERFKTPKVSISYFSTEQFEWQIYCKNWFSDRAFYVIIADADNESLKSLHTLFDKYLDHMLVKFEQTGIVRTIQKFWQKMPGGALNFFFGGCVPRGLKNVGSRERIFLEK